MSARGFAQLLACLAVTGLFLTIQAAVITSAASGSWHQTTTWQGGILPGENDSVVIAAGHVVTVERDTAAGAIYIPVTSGRNGIDLADGVTLAVTRAVTVGASSTSVTGTSEMRVGGGVLTATNISINGYTASSSYSKGLVSVSTGIIMVTGNISFNSQYAATFTSTGSSTVYVGGNFGGGGILNTSGTGTIIFNGSVAQTIGAYTTYNNIEIRNTSGGVSFTGATTINGNLAVVTGTLSAGTNTITLAGTNKELSGTLTFANLTVSGSYTNKGDLTVTSALSGTGSLTNAAGATLTIGGTSGITTLVASPSPNTVIYNGAAQTVKAITYHHLVLGGSGTKTITGLSTVNGDFTVTGSASATATTGLTIGGNLTISGTAILADGGYQIAGTSGKNLTVGAGAILRLGAGTATTFPTGFQRENISLDDASTVDYYANVNQDISATPASYGNLTISRSSTGTPVKTALGPLLVNGSLTINASTTLADGGFTITVRGPVSNSGTHTSTGSGKLLLTGSSASRTISTTGAFGNLELNDPNGVTTSGAFSMGSLTITSGTFTMGAVAHTVSGATSITGTLAMSSSSGTKTFSGDVTINAGGRWNNSGNASVTLSGSLVNNSVNPFVAGTGTYTFNGTGKEISSVTSLSIPNLTVSGTITNKANLTVGTALSGGGNLINAAGATLTIGGTSGINTLTATAEGNTVVYNGTAAQIIKGTSYHHLTVSTTGGNATLGAATVVNGTLNVASGTTLALSSYNLTVNGDFTNVSGATISQGGAGAMIVTGTYVNNGTHTQSSTGGLSVGAFTNNNVYNATTSSNTLTVTNLFTNSATGVITRSNSGTWNLNGGFVNAAGGQYSHSGTGDLYVTGNFLNEGSYSTSGASGLMVSGDLINAGTISKTAAGEDTVAGLFWNKPEGSFIRGTNSIGYCWLKGGFLNEGSYSAAVATSPLVVGVAAGGGDFTNDGAFDNSGNGALTFNGNFTNNQVLDADANFGTGLVTFGGTNVNTSLGGSGITSFGRMAVSKAAGRWLNLNANLNLTAAQATVLNISAGNLLVNGVTLNVPGSTSSGPVLTGAPTCTLRVAAGSAVTLGQSGTGATVVTLNQASGALGAVIIDGGTVDIYGRHSLYHSTTSGQGHFKLNGGTVTYHSIGTGTSAALYLTTAGSSVPAGNGWFASGGTVDFKGGVYCFGSDLYSGYILRFVADGAVVKFSGSNAGGFNFNGGSYSVAGSFHLGNLRIEKSNATVTFTSSNSMGSSFVEMNGLVVAPTATLDLAGTHASGYGYRVNGSVTNDGSITRSSGSNNNLVVTGSFTNNGVYSTSVAAGLTVSGDFTNNGSFTQTAAGTVTVTGLFWNRSGKTVERGSNSTGTWNLNGGFRNDGTYTATTAASPLTLGAASPFTQGATGTFTNGGGAVQFGSTFTNAGTFTTTGAGSVTFSGSAENTSSGTMERAAGSIGAYTFNAGFTNNGIFKNATTTAGFTVNGAFVNSSTADFRNTGNSNIQFNGDFTNEQADANWGTGTVIFGGNTSGNLAGSQQPVFARVQVNKTGSPLPALTLQANLTVPDLVLSSGSLITNGYDLTVNDSILGTSAGILSITSSAVSDAASTVSVGTLFQGASTGVGRVLVEGAGATLNIGTSASGQHILNYGGSSFNNYFLLSGTGATVNYLNASGTGNSASLVLTTSSGTNASNCGWFATSGTVNFYGNIYSPYASSSYRQYFQASSGATVRFVGSSASEVNLAVTYAPSAGYAVWDFGTMQVAKSGSPAPAVTFTSTATGCATVVQATGGVTVNAGNMLKLHGQFASGSYGYNFSGGLLNNGTIERGSTPTAANNHLTTGAFTNNGIFRTNANTANLTVNGNFLNASTATFDNTANGNLFFNGDFRNDQSDPAKALWSTSAGTNTITFGGTGNTTVRHATTLLNLDCNVAVDKGAIDRTVTLESGLNLQQSGRTLSIISGTLVTNNNHLYVYQSGSAITGGANGRLRVTGSSNVSVMNLNQGSGQLKEIVLEGTGTFVIDGIHTLHYSAASNKFIQSGNGTVNYNGTGTGTSSALYLTSGSALLSPPDLSGWFISAGTVNFFGGIYAAHSTSGYATVLQAQSPGVVRFVGNQAASVNLAGNADATGIWSIDDLRVQKTSSFLTITSSYTLSGTSFAIGSLTVGSGSTLNLSGSFGAGYGYDVAGNISNSGAIVMQSGINNNLYVGGNWSGSGAFTPAGRTVVFDHSTSATVSLPSGSTFYNLTVNKSAGGSLSLAGNVQVGNALRVQSGTFSVGQNTLTIGTTTQAGQVTVDAGATFSAVGAARTFIGAAGVEEVIDTGSDALAQIAAASEAYPYAFTVNSGATIAASYAKFSKPNTAGIVVKSGAMIAPAPQNFSNCEFDHGAISGPMLRLENNEAHAISNVSFNGTATEGVGFNISKSQAASGRIDVLGGSGNRWGSRYEQDPAELIYWKPNLDVACVQVFAPTGLVDSGSTVVPSCSVYNAGLTAATFVVRMNIGGNMVVRNYTVSDLAPGAGQRCNFSSWVANVTPGTYQVRCSTRLSGDQEELNNRQGPFNILVVKRDVRVHSILVPTGSYRPGEEVQPEAIWANDGNVPGGASFEAWMIITDPDGIERYRQKEDVHVAERSQLQVQFTQKLVLNQPGDWTVRCSTGYAGDMIPSNDVKERVFTVTATNVGVKSLASPVPGGRYAVGGQVVPAATWRNYGEESADFDAWVVITGPGGERYAHSRPQTGVGPGEERVVSDFPACVLSSVGIWTVRCSTYYADDKVPADDTLDREFSVVDEDVSVDSVAVPVPGRAYLPGVELTPRAVWRNRSATAAADFWVWMILSSPTLASDAVGDVSSTVTDTEVYRDSVFVAGLAPGRDTVVYFRTTGSLWTGGMWTVRCSTYMVNDPAPQNDTLSCFFSIGRPDMAVTAILAPLGTVEKGKTVHPAATLKNNGDCVVTLEARFTMWNPASGTDGKAYDTVLVIPGISVGVETTITFPSFEATTATGTWVTRCSVYVESEETPEDNVLYSSFKVEDPDASLWEPGMGVAGSVPDMGLPDGKAPQVGAWLATGPEWQQGVTSGKEESDSLPCYRELFSEGPVIYVAKGNKTSDFGKFNPLNNVWTELASIPDVEEGKLKPPAKGTVGVCAFNDTAIYMTRGNNMLGFYRYDIKRNEWTRIHDVPAGPKGKKVKGGNDLAYVYRADTNWIYLLKGGLNEFYRYNVEAGRWDTLENAPYTGTSAVKYDKGSFLVTDGRDYIYAHRGKYNDGSNYYMFRYDVANDTWYKAPLKGLPLDGYEGGVLKKKKAGDGAAGAWYDGYIYAMKGGNTHSFYRYTVSTGVWEQIDTIPRNGPAGKKAVKAGGDLVFWGKRTFFLLKGNKCPELWRYVVPTSGVRSYISQVSGAQSQAQPLVGMLRIMPNPIATGFVTVRFACGTATESRERSYGQYPAYLRVVDAAGRCVLQQTCTTGHSTFVLDMRSLSFGVYLVFVDAAGLTTAQKLVVRR